MTTVTETNGLQATFRNLATSGTPTIGPSMRDRTYLNFSPRLGFAYDRDGARNDLDPGRIRHLL